MEMKWLIPIIMFWQLRLASGQDEASYQRIEILTASSADHSRSTEW